MPLITLPARGDIPETSIYFETMLGEGSSYLGENNRPIIIFLPGGPGGNHTVYNEIKDALIKSADLVLWDPRGCGNSQASDCQFCTIDHYVDDIEALRIKLKIDKPIIVGGSYGSMAGLGYAIKYPDSLVGLFCIAGTSHGGFIDRALANLEKYHASEEQIALAKKLFSGSIASSEEMALFYRTLMPLYVYSPKAKSDVEEFLAKPPTLASAKPAPIHIINYGYGEGGFLRTFDWRPKLKDIVVPTRLVCGDHDWINDQTFGEETFGEIRKGSADVSLVKLENCGHFQWRDQRENFLNELVKFIEQLNCSLRPAVSLRS